MNHKNSIKVGSLNKQEKNRLDYCSVVLLTIRIRDMVLIEMELELGEIYLAMQQLSFSLLPYLSLKLSVFIPFKTRGIANQLHFETDKFQRDSFSFRSFCQTLTWRTSSCLARKKNIFYSLSIASSLLVAFTDESRICRFAR